MAKFYLQEMPDIEKDGKRRVYPKMQTYRQVSTEELVERIRVKSGVFKEGVINGVLMTMVDALVDYLSLGYTVKIDGLGIISTSLEFTDDKATELGDDENEMKYRRVRVKDVNFKSDKKLVNDIRENTDLERASSDVNTISKAKYTPEERLARALAHIDKYGSINLYEYCKLNDMSRSSASRDLNTFSNRADSGIVAKGHAPHKMWVKSDNNG